MVLVCQTTQSMAFKLMMAELQRSLVQHSPGFLLVWSATVIKSKTQAVVARFQLVVNGYGRQTQEISTGLP